MKRPEYEPLSPKELLEMGRSTEDPLARAMFFLCYLTGARVSEAARFIRLRLTIQDDFYIIMSPVLKKRKNKGLMRAVPIPRGDKAKCYENEMIADLLAYLGSDEAKSADYPFWKWGRPTAKNPKGRPDSMGVYLSREIPLSTYARKPDANLGFLDVKVAKPLHSHFLRHCRAQHLHEFYKFDDTKLRFYFEWSSADMAIRYTHKFKKMELFA